MTRPFARALGGMRERKRRADRAVGEKGLKRVWISVMNFVIILGGRVAGRRWLSRRVVFRFVGVVTLLSLVCHGRDKCRG